MCAFVVGKQQRTFADYDAWLHLFWGTESGREKQYMFAGVSCLQLYGLHPYEVHWWPSGFVILRIRIVHLMLRNFHFHHSKGLLLFL